ncbi:MAG: methyltransferase domain-containing protein [bacterium]
MQKIKPMEKKQYFDTSKGLPIKQPALWKVLVSRLCFPVLALLSRENSLKIGLTPIDDERVIMVLKFAKGRVLDIGCGANNFVHSYPQKGIGVDVYPWQGVDVVVKSAAKLPFEKGKFKTVTYIACLNHIPNRAESLKEASRVTTEDGRVIVTMVSPLWGRFIHWLRFKNDPDHQDRDIDHDHELLGMHSTHVRSLMKDAGFVHIRQKRFVFGINTVYIGDKINPNK